MRAALTVAETADALGTSPQTVRTMLRKGALRGHKRPWGSRYVWEVSPEAVDEFIAEFGRLDGHRRSPRIPSVEGPEEGTTVTTGVEAPDASGSVPLGDTERPEDTEQPDRRPFVLRPRGRATVVVVLVGVPLLLAYAAARIYPGALWFDELGQADVFQRTVTAKADFYIQVGVNVAVFVAVNLALALKGTRFLRTPGGIVAVAATSVVTGSLFASAVDGHWRTYQLWRHRQAFGIVDPLHGKDVGFFVFSLPLLLLLSTVLLWLVAVTAGYVALAHRAKGTLGLRTRHATFGAQLHLAALAALFLLVVAWRIHLGQYTLELGQPSPGDAHSFAGAGYVDVNVRLPGLVALSRLAMVLAGCCLAAPFVARTRFARPARLAAVTTGAVVTVGAALAGALAPVLVQRYVVDPNPLLSEEPFLARSITATRTGLGLDTVSVEQYTPTGTIRAGDFPSVSRRVAHVPVWDTWLLEARMRQLVTDSPYYRPENATLDVVRVHGRRQPTVVSARRLDLDPVPEGARTWINDRLAYTHGLGLVRFSGTDVDDNRTPHLLDAGLGLREPRIYFGTFPRAPADRLEDERGLDLLTPAAVEHLAQSPWVLVDTRRPEVDVAASDGAVRAPYHYDGSGGIELSSWVRRTAFALALGSKELLLSDDITPDSRLLLNRDVHDRLRTLAPFIQWDSSAVPLTANGGIVFVVDGYTTSENYPYAERVRLGGASVNYARASVRATVDAFSGKVELYLTDETDPLARAWREIYPTLFRPQDEMPAELRERLRYPADLFDAQATAYERFHTTRPDLFVSDADEWSRPIALSGPIEVAGDIDFDEDDEDDLRLTMQPGYTFTPPPGHTRPRIVRGTYFTPRRAQNLVGTLSGWVDQDGRVRLAARGLPRDRVTLGPAQMSRLVFAHARVRNLLGLRNLEIRDVDKSSLDTVLLGRPHLMFLPGGVVQIQSLYEGSRGPGAARLLGVTAFLNGRAGLGPDIQSALRQALNEPPRVKVLPPPEPAVVGHPVALAFRVESGRRETVTITSGSGSHTETLRVSSGRGKVTWLPRVPGDAHVRVTVTGLDGTTVSDAVTLEVLDTPPTLRLLDPPRRAVAGRPVRVRFAVTRAVTQSVKISTRAGIVFTRRFDIRKGTGVVTWVPETPGPAVLQIRTLGQQRQAVTRRLRLVVAPRDVASPPTVTLVRVPEEATVGLPSRFAFRATECRTASARLEGPDGSLRTWRFQCPADPARITWTPTEPGRYLFTATSAGEGTTSRASVRLVVEDGEAVDGGEDVE